MREDSWILILCVALSTEFTGAQALKDWIKKNPTGLSFYYDLTSRNLPDALIPSFVLFHNSQKGVGGLVVERHVVLGTLKSIVLKREEGVLGVSERTCW